MAVGIGVEGALRAIESTAERALSDWGKADGVPSKLYEWGPLHGLHPLPVALFRHLRKERTFDTLEARMGAVWLPPLISTEEVPIIVGLTRNEEELCIRIGLFRLEGEESRAIGMRFETPHPGSEAHEFHHAQLWTHIRRGDVASSIVDPNAWVPEKQPSFPLRAKNPVELLWAAAVSIYGKRDAVLPFEADSIVEGDLTKYLRNL